MRRTAFRFGFLAALALAVTTGECRAGWQFAKVADTSTAIPGHSGMFTSFSEPVINGKHLAFQGGGAGGLQGVYTLTIGGPIKAVADTTMNDPNGHTFSQFYPPAIDPGGRVIFAADTAAGSGIYQWLNGRLTVIATVGTPVPDRPGYSFSAFTTLLPSVSIDRGAITFSAWSTDNGQVNDGIYLYSAGAIRTVADRTTPVPYGNGSLDMVFFDRPHVDSGNVIFEAQGPNGQVGVFESVGGVLKRVVDDTETLPGSTQVFQADGTIIRGPTNPGAHVAFYADAGFDPASGYYRFDSRGRFFPLVDGNSISPLGGHFVAEAELSVAKNGSYTFWGQTQQDVALFYSPTFTGTTLTRVVGYLDTLDGKTVNNVDSGFESFTATVLVFAVEFSDQSAGVYTATLTTP